MVSERKPLDPGSLDPEVVVRAYRAHGVNAFYRSRRPDSDTPHEVQVRPLFPAPPAADGWSRKLVGGLLLAVSLLGCGSREDLVIGNLDFSVLRHDDFDGDALDSDYWEVATHTFPDNLAWFSTDNAKVVAGMLVLSITDVPSPNTPTKSFSAAEVRTRVPFLYGRFRARVRFAAGAGVVSAFWGFYDHYSMSSGTNLENQIVIESGFSDSLQTSALRYLINVPVDPLEPTTFAPGFEPSADFHVIGFDWTPTEVSFYLDGKAELVVTGPQATQLREYQRLVLSAYPSSAGWLGNFDPSRLPITAELDWVEVAEYRGPRP